MFRRKAEQDLDDELQASIDLLAEEHIARGVAPREALRLVRIELGGVEQVKEEVRAARGFPALDSSSRTFTTRCGTSPARPAFLSRWW